MQVLNNENSSDNEFPRVSYNSILQYLQFPEILTGREVEKRVLIDTYKKVCNGVSRLTLISGDAGIGKTSLIKSLGDVIGDTGGLFVSGKADQYNADVPCQIFTEIVKAIIRRLLMLSDSSLDELKKSLVDKLGKDIHFLYDFMPDMRYITGHLNKYYPAEAGYPEVMFKNALSVFLRTVSTYYGSLLVFLDDIQWADSATLKIIKHIIDENIPGLYIICAYRDNEVKEDHPVTRMINEASTSPDALHLIRLDTLGDTDVEKIIVETLKDGSPRIKKLASFVYKKTGGNPFYIREFMQNLVIRECLVFDNQRWLWDDIKSHAIPATDNVLVMLSEMMKTLPDRELTVIKTAACLGNSFSVELLMFVLDIKHSTLASVLNSLENNNYIITTDGEGSRSFSHDKIREAAYELIAPDQKMEIHGKAGMMLLRLGKAGTDIFAIADHLNRAYKAVIDDAELIQINLDAGLKAKNNFAYESGISYLERALSIYNNAEFIDSRLKFEILNAYSECLYLNAEYDMCEDVICMAISLTDDVIEKGDLYNRIIMLKAIQLNYDESVKIGLQAVSLFGIRFETDSVMREVEVESVRSNLAPILNRMSIDDILNLPECRRPDINKVTQIIKNISSSLYHLGDWKFAYLVHSEIVRLTLEHGVTIDSPEGLVGHALITIIFWNDVGLGYRLGIAALQLSQKYGHLQQLSSLGVHYGVYILLWRKHLKHSLAILKTGSDAGIKSGEYLFVGYSVSHVIFTRLVLGDNLKSLLNELENALILMLKLKNDLMYKCLAGLKIVLSNLTGKTGSTDCFIFDNLSEHELVMEYDEKRMDLAHAVYALYKSSLLYLYYNYTESLSLMKMSMIYNSTILGSVHVIEYHFYLALNLAALDHQNGGYRLQFNEIEMMFEGYAAECPENFSCRHQLLKAERASLEHDIAAAMTLYDMAITSARENGYIQIEAIASERAGLFWIAMNKTDFAKIYIKRAYDLFGKWGAESKTELMKKQYPEILNEHPEIDGLTNEDILLLVNNFNQISRDLEINNLVKTICEIMLQQSGADLFAMIIENEGKIRIQVSATPDSSGTKFIPPVLGDENRNNLIPVEMINYIRRTGEKVVVYDGDRESIFFNTPYFRKTDPASALCVRSDAGEYRIIMYFENRFIKSYYAGTRMTLLDLLLNQSATCLQNAMYLMENSKKSNSTGFVFKFYGIKKIIPYSEILYFSSDGRHTSLITKNEVYDIPLLLKDVVRALPSDIFMRAHKRYVVNMNSISGLKRSANGGLIMQLAGNVTLPVGRAYSVNFRKMISTE